MLSNKNIVKAALCTGVGFIGGICCHGPQRPEAHVGLSKTIIRDTVRIAEPAVVSARPLAPVLAALPIARTDSGADTASRPDTAMVVVRPESREYAGDGYRAWVSGWHPSLDSIAFERTATIERIAVPTPPRRFSIGVQAGYGLTPAGPQPYIGLGIAYRIF